MVRIFLVTYFYQNGQSAKSLPSYLTHLKSGQLEREFEWFSEPQLFTIRRTVRALQRLQPLDLRTVHRKTPLTLSILQQMEDSTATSSLFEFFTFCRVLHNGLLRSGEGCALKCSDLEWTTDRQAVRLRIYNSKMNKTGPVEHVELMNWGPASAVAYLRRYEALQAPSLHPDTLLFPSYANKPVFVRQLKACMTQAGISGSFAGHSFRSGGASDLWACNVPLEAIQKVGRWKSDAIKLYLRDTAVTSHKIAEAFRLCSEHEFWGI